jgi:hypothetical protein
MMDNKTRNTAATTRPTGRSATLRPTMLVYHADHMPAVYRIVAYVAGVYTLRCYYTPTHGQCPVRLTCRRCDLVPIDDNGPAAWGDYRPVSPSTEYAVPYYATVAPSMPLASRLWATHTAPMLHAVERRWLASNWT